MLHEAQGEGVAALYNAMASKVGKVRRGQASRIEFSATDRARTKRR